MVKLCFPSVFALAAVASTLPVPVWAAHKPVAITITENGARSRNVSGDETPALCAAFRLSKDDVKQFVAKSRQVTSHEYNHDLEMSRCYAAGRVVYPSGVTGRWWIDMERRGLFILDNGRRLYFYCAACTAPNFDEPYDPAVDG